MSAPIQIRRPEVVEDVRTLAGLLGTSLTGAVEKAVKAQLAVEKANADANFTKRWNAVRKIVEEFHRLPRVGPRLTDADLYDEEGLPK